MPDVVDKALAPQTGPSETVEDDPKVFVLSRELSEVHLLLDNLSADPETTIAVLSRRQPPDGLDEHWLDAVCRISWPPPDGEANKAEQAALLIRAKDYLNRLARPASGATIAFTVLVTQDDDDGDGRSTRRPGLHMEEAHSRASLARIAFPDYHAKAQRFRKVQWRINLVLLAFLVLTCLTSWYVAYGNSTLNVYAAAQKRLADAQLRVDNAEAGRPALAAAADSAGAAESRLDASAPAPEATGEGGEAAAPGEIGYCNRWTEAPGPSPGASLRRYGSADQLQACRELDEAKKQVALAEDRLREWLWPWGWIIDRRSGAVASIAAHLTSIIGTAALPVFYGFLGAGAAVLRSISHRIRASTLSPRDLSLSLQQLALGAVIGACIGLFISQPGEEQALIGPVALSVSAISFIAGFGVEAVFQALEALISRIFNIAPAAAGRAPPRER